MVTAIIAAVSLRQSHAPLEPTPLNQLSLRYSRPFETRLAGFPWSRLDVQPSASRSAAGLTTLRGEAAEPVKPAGTGRQSRYASGVSYLLIGNVRKAADELEHAAAGSRDPRVWNDLAVALDAAAGRGEASRYPEALAATDRALQWSAHFPEALFNRALILEHLGFIDAAIAQWHAYLSIDPATPWSAEARTHLAALEKAVQGVSFADALNRASDAYFKGAATPLDDLVRAWPQDARSWGEGPLLKRWSQAWQSGDTAAEQGVISLARHIAEQLSKQSGERLLLDAVAVIDASRNDLTRLRLLAEGHLHYDTGRMLGIARPASAEAELREAELRFARAGSPMAQVAEHYRATTIFDQNRISEARAILESLAARCDREHHRALDALELAQLARCSAFAGEWTAALQNALRSMQLFESLRENVNAAFTRASVAGAYDHVGDSNRAWSLWISSMKGLASGKERSRRQSSVANAIRSCIRNRRYDGARALAEAAIADLRTSGNALVLSDTLIQRARAAAELGDDASSAIAEAETATASLRDVAQKTRAEADLTIVRGIAARRSDPASSVALFSGAVDFYSEREYRPWLIEALFQRGRSFAAASQTANALADYRSAIDASEQQRSNIADASGREGFFDIEPELFEETIALQLRMNDPARAFATADQFRARALREQLGAATTAPPLNAENVQRALSPGAALVEYAFVPSGLAIFCLTPQSLTAEQVTIDRGSLRALIGDFRAAIESEGNIAHLSEMGRQLDEILVAPIRPALAGAAQVTFVADRDIQSVPFAALVDGGSGRYLIEEQAIALAPSAGMATRGRQPYAARTIALIVGNPDVPDLPPLHGAEREAAALGRLFPGSVVLTRSAATKQQFVARAGDATLIHFAGHTRPEGSGPAALLFAGAGGNAAGLDAGEIARLPLSSAELVVVAGCSSGRGETSRMEGVPSLARAFLAAGAKTVVATMWDIDDGLTLPLFKRFHRAVAARQSAARALQQAQIAALHSSDPSERHPSTWGGITVFLSD